MHNKFLMGVKFETSWGVAAKIFKNTLLERVFEKMVSNLSVLEGIFEAYFFSKNFKGIFYVKLKVSSIN